MSQKDWDKIRACFVIAKQALPEIAPVTKTAEIEGQRRELARSAAKFMRPRADTKRLEEQILFVCFGIE